MRAFWLSAAFGFPLAAQATDLRLVVVPDRLDARIALAKPGAFAALVLGLQAGVTPLLGGARLDLVPEAVPAFGFANADGTAALAMPLVVGQAAGLQFLAQAVAFDVALPLAAPGALQVTPLRVGRVPAVDEGIDLVVLFGQSNAEGTAPLAGLPAALRGVQPQLRIWSGADGSWQPLTAGTNNQLVPHTATVGPELGMAEVARGWPRPLWLVKLAVSQSSLGPSPGPWSEWGHTAGELYPLLLQHVDAACAAAKSLGLAPRVQLVCMMQGESDCTHATLANAYGNNLRDLLTQLRADLHQRDLALPDGPHFRLGLVAPTLPGSGFPEVTTVRHAQSAVAASLPGCDTVETRGMQLQSDQVHLAQEGLRALGRTFLAGIGQ